MAETETEIEFYLPCIRGRQVLGSLGLLTTDTAMTSSLLDSKATFEARLQAFGVAPAHVAAMLASNVDTLAKLAFASSSQPGVGDDKPFVQMIHRVLGLNEGDLDDGQLAPFRRAWFEAHTVSLSEMRQRVERTEESAPRKMPVPERSARLEAQRLRLLGVSITGNLVPSFSLIDFTMNMKEEEQLHYIDPDRCTDRQQELLGVKREHFIKPGNDGLLRITETTDSGKADMTTEHRVRLALQRRSLALDQCDLLKYSISEQYHDFLYSLVVMIPPPGFKEIDIVQILNADRAIWARMCEHTTSGISVRADGTYPLESALTLARIHPMVACLLQPLARGSQQRGKGSGVGKPARDAPYASKGSKAKGDSKGRGKSVKGKSKGSMRMPLALVGCKSHTVSGEKICFNFNLPSGCSRAVADGKCSAGSHSCCGCLSTAHGYQACA